MNEMKIKEYMICWATDEGWFLLKTWKSNIHVLEERVNDRIKEGWQPFGYTHFGDGSFVYQAMVKYE
jgi:hypothetical protein